MMYPIIALIGIMLLTWGVAVWASFDDEVSPSERHEGMPADQSLRKVA